jgi:hypothetical protein
MTPHYHIKWKENNEIDWEPFTDAIEAGQRAELLAQRGDKFTVEYFRNTCPVCNADVLAAAV